MRKHWILIVAATYAPAAIAACGGDDDEGAPPIEPSSEGSAPEGGRDGSTSVSDGASAVDGASGTDGGGSDANSDAADGSIPDGATPDGSSGVDGGYVLADYSGDAGFPITRLLRPKAPCGAAGFPRAAANGVTQLLDMTNEDGTIFADPPIARSGDRAATSASGRWMLWDLTTLEQIKTVEGEMVDEGKTQYFVTHSNDQDEVSVRAFNDGHEVGRITGLDDVVRVGLAEDESYVYVLRGDGTLDTYSPSGAPVLHRNGPGGNYGFTKVFAAPNEIRIGSRPFVTPPWTERIALPGGAVTKRTFTADSGTPTFRNWFAGGDYFIIDLSPTRADVYTKDGIFVTGFPGGDSNLNVGGSGFYYWRRRPGAAPGLEVYDVRSPATTPAFFPGPDEMQQIVHDRAMYIDRKVVVFDPAGLRTEPADIPTLAEVHGIRADASGRWILGDELGGVFVGKGNDVAVLGCGRPTWAAAAGETSPRVAVATQSSAEIYVFDIGPTSAGLVARIPMMTQDFAFAADGTRLVVAPDKIRGVPYRGLHTFALPGGALVSPGPEITPYTLFRTSRGGSTLARNADGARAIISNLDGTSETFRETGPLGGTGGGGSVPNPAPALPSPSGSHVAVNDTYDLAYPAKARIVTDTNSVTINGYVYAWLDENRLLARRYTPPDGSVSPGIEWVILDPAGNVLARPNLQFYADAATFARREPVLLDSNTLLVFGDAFNLTTGAMTNSTGLRRAFGISGNQRVSYDSWYLVFGPR